MGEIDSGRLRWGREIIKKKEYEERETQGQKVCYEKEIYREVKTAVGRARRPREYED